MLHPAPQLERKEHRSQREAGLGEAADLATTPPTRIGARAGTGLERQIG
jgi:hypothetical protein